MTQEEKELLIKDLCARLPYGVKGLHRGEVHDLFTIDGREANSACIQVDSYDAWFPIETFKPYLRPMSSMTEEERKTYKSLQDSAYSYHYEFGDIVDDVLYFDNDVSLDYLNSIHVDYRGLIEKSLAIVAPEEMYK